MKAIFLFNLPEEHEEYEIIQRASEYYNIIFDFREWLFHKYEHTRPASKQAYAEYEEICEKFAEILDKYEYH